MQFWHIFYLVFYSSSSLFGLGKIYLMFLKKVSYLFDTKNSDLKKPSILIYFNMKFSAEITAVFGVMWSFRNHFNMLIWCSRIIPSYYQFLTVVLVNIFVETMIFWKNKLRIHSKMHTVTFDLFDPSLLNKIISKQ